MDDGSTGESRDAVLAAAMAVDAAFTEVTFKKWRDRGLVPRPTARPGRGQRLGRGAVYPVGTTAQLLRVLELRAAGGRFDPDRALWRLWWEGYNVETEHVCDLLRKDLAALRSTIARLWIDGDLTERGRAECVRLATSNLTEPLRTARRAVGSDRLVGVCEVLMRVAAGAFCGWDPSDDPRAVEAAVGVDRARHDRIGTTPPWLRGSLEPVLVRLSAAAAPDRLGEALDDTSPDELVAARDEVRDLLVCLDDARTVLETLRGPGAFGLARFPDRAGAPKWWPRALLPYWLSFRNDPPLRDGIETMLGLVPLAALLRHEMELFPPPVRDAPRRDRPARSRPR